MTSFFGRPVRPPSDKTATRLYGNRPLSLVVPPLRRISRSPQLAPNSILFAARQLNARQDGDLFAARVRRVHRRERRQPEAAACRIAVNISDQIDAAPNSYK